jgi:putative AlgH/UPF0301 family transcriptional regulator
VQKILTGLQLNFTLINQFLICIPFTLCDNEFMRAMLLIVAHEHAVGSGGQLGLPFCRSLIRSEEGRKTPDD